MRSKWIRAGMIACALAIGVSAAAAKPADSVWNVLTDFRPSPNQANPSPDHHNVPDVWRYMEGPTSGTHDPGTYTLYPDFVVSNNCQHIWRSASLNIGVPTLALDLCQMAPRFTMHPEGSRNTILGWKAPLTGTVGVSGSVADGDNSCGNGIEWWIDKNSTTLASGSIPEGGSQTFAAGTGGASLADFAVTAGDFVYLIIGPLAGHFICDTTVVNFVVTQNTPTSVVVRSLTAARTKAGSTITWRTDAQSRVAGFHLWRSDAGTATRINRALIPATRSGVYRLVDRTARRGTAYVYRLQSVGLDGKRTWRGSVRVGR